MSRNSNSSSDPGDRSRSLASRSDISAQVLNSSKQVSGSPADSTSSKTDLREQYSDQVSTLNPNSKDIDLKAVGRHLVNQENSLRLQGGDVTRNVYQTLEQSNPSSHRTPRARSTSFSTYLEEARRGSMASDINVPGGFRREFIINKSVKENKTPPNILTRNFMEFLSIYGHFAGEDFTEDDATSSRFEDVFDEESPLLAGEDESPPPRLKQQKGAASVLKTFFLLFKALVGSGVLFLPRAFYNGGLLFSIVSLSTFGFLTYFCYVVLIDSKTTLGKSSYGELGYISYGKNLKVCILISIILSQVGFVATYILFTAENMSSFIVNTLKFESVTTFDIVVAECLLLVPLSFIRNLAQLSVISLISSVFVVVGLLIIFFYSGLSIVQNGIGAGIVAFNSNSWSMLIGVAVTSFEGIGLILPIESSMAEPEKFPRVLLVSMISITTLFVSIGVIGYTSFGDKVKSIIILNLPQGSYAVQLIVLLYSLAVFLSAPLQLLPAVKIGESTIFNSRLFRGASKKKDDDGRLYRSSGKYNSTVKWLKNGNRTFSVILICFIAFMNSNNIDKFVSFNGCFACIPLVYIYPPLIHLKALKAKPSLSSKDRVIRSMDYAIVIVGVVVALYSTYQILFLN